MPTIPGFRELLERRQRELNEDIMRSQLFQQEFMGNFLTNTNATGIQQRLQRIREQANRHNIERRARQLQLGERMHGRMANTVIVDDPADTTTTERSHPMQYVILPHPALDYDIATTPGLLVHPHGALYQAYAPIKHILMYGNGGFPVTFTVDDGVPQIASTLDPAWHEFLETQLQDEAVTNRLDGQNAQRTLVLYHIPVDDGFRLARNEYDIDVGEYIIPAHSSLLAPKNPHTLLISSATPAFSSLASAREKIDDFSATFKQAVGKAGLSLTYVAHGLFDMHVEHEHFFQVTDEAKSNVHTIIGQFQKLDRQVPAGFERILYEGIALDNDMKLQKITDPLRGQSQPIKTGKAMRALHPQKTDEEIKTLAADFDARTQPPEFKITYARDEMRRVYMNGPSSCMTHGRDYYAMLGECDDPDARPTDALANGDIGLAYLERHDGKVTARTLVVESRKEFVRIYMADFASAINGEPVLAQKLDEAGYTRNPRALVGQHLPKLEVPMTTWLEDQDNVRGPFDLSEAPEPRAFLCPYLDTDNPVVIEHEDTLEVTNVCETSSQYHEIDDQFRHNRNYFPERAGRSYYEAGGVVTFELSSAAQRIQTPQPAPQPPQAEQAEPEPSVNDARNVTELQNALTYCSSPSLQAVVRRLIDTIDMGFGGNGNRCRIWLGDILGFSTHAFTKTEAANILDVGGDDITLALTPGGNTAWAEEDETEDICDEIRIETLLDRYSDIIWDDEDDEWIDRNDAVRLHDGSSTHRDNAVYVEGIDEWYHSHDDEVVYCELEGVYRLEEDCVPTQRGWVDRNDAYRLPNGDYIHEEDLERA